MGGVSPLDWDEVNSTFNEATGLTYVDNPALHDPSRDIILYDPNIHLHVFDYVTIGEITYTRSIMLEDWDQNTVLWDPWSMGMWPFGTPLTPEFEVWSVMEKMKDELELILMDEEEEDWNLMKVTMRVMIIIHLIMVMYLVMSKEAIIDKCHMRFERISCKSKIINLAIRGTYCK